MDELKGELNNNRKAIKRETSETRRHSYKGGVKSFGITKAKKRAISLGAEKRIREREEKIAKMTPEQKEKYIKKCQQLSRDRNTERVNGIFVPQIEMGPPTKYSKLSDILKEKLDLWDPQKKRTHREMIALKLIRMAEAGDMRSITEILNRLEGKMPDKTEVSGSLPITIVFKPVDETPLKIEAPKLIEEGNGSERGIIHQNLPEEQRVEG